MEQKILMETRSLSTAMEEFKNKLAEMIQIDKVKEIYKESSSSDVDDIDIEIKNIKPTSYAGEGAFQLEFEVTHPFSILIDKEGKHIVTKQFLEEKVEEIFADSDKIYDISEPDE
jgi:hypothetical protein